MALPRDAAELRTSIDPYFLGVKFPNDGCGSSSLYSFNRLLVEHYPAQTTENVRSMDQLYLSGNESDG